MNRQTTLRVTGQACCLALLVALVAGFAPEVIPDSQATPAAIESMAPSSVAPPFAAVSAKAGAVAFASLIPGETAECHCCEDEWVGPLIEDWEHWFPTYPDYCEGCEGGANLQGGEHDAHCVLCGGSSECHEDPEPNVCHLDCEDWDCNPHVDPECSQNLAAGVGLHDPTVQVAAMLAELNGPSSAAT